MSETIDPIDAAATGQVEFTRWLAQLRTDMAETVNGTLLRGARAVPVDSTRPKPTFSPGALLGFTAVAREEVLDAHVWIRDVEGNLIAQAVLVDTAGQRHAPTVWFGPGGINIPAGGLVVFADADFEGVVYLRGAD